MARSGTERRSEAKRGGARPGQARQGFILCRVLVGRGELGRG